MKKLIKEIDDLYSVSQRNQWEEIEDSFLKTAAAAGCFKDGFTPNVKDPDLGIDAVEQKKKDDATGILISVFHTNKESKKNPGRTLSYQYSGASPNYEYVGTVAYKCKQLEKRTNPDFLSGVGKELYNVLTTPIANNGLGYKGYGDVKGTDILNYELVNLNTDPDLKEGGRFYEKVKGIKGFFNTLQNQKLNIWLWKPRKGTGAVLDIPAEQEKILNKYINDNDKYYKCAKGGFDSGEVTSIDLSVSYPDVFDKGFLVCKNYSDISTTKKDCSVVIDEYMKEIKRYNNSGGKMKPTSAFFNTRKPKINACIAQNLGKMPLRNKEMKFFQSLRASSPFFLGNIGESKDNLTSIIRESLRIVKKRKNSY
jgi:hypothetical protein